ncbi:hypothetical protein PM082_015394 [Marasmius tenuissimus]|nr:hypothetical protein PM082_015394 [Marasmius tenuissimus]
MQVLPESQDDRSDGDDDGSFASSSSLHNSFIGGGRNKRRAATFAGIWNIGRPDLSWSLIAISTPARIWSYRPHRREGPSSMYLSFIPPCLIYRRSPYAFPSRPVSLIRVPCLPD